MDGFITAIIAIFEFMQTTWHLGKYNISFWEILVWSVLASIVVFVIRQLLDVDD